MERLGHCIDWAVKEGWWKPITVGRGGPKVSHLFFAYDLFLFGEASTDQVEVMVRCLNVFCSCSGEKVNFDKSRMFCSKGVGHFRADELSRVMGVSLTSNLGKYLGVDLHHDRVGKSTFKAVVQKVKKRLSSWKAESLSLAGRVTLTQSVSSSIPVYTMQSAMLPVSICDEIDKANSAFIWGDSESGRKPHLVSWQQVVQPKECGGLGIRQMRAVNKAFMVKLGWGLINKRRISGLKFCVRSIIVGVILFLR